MYHSVSNDLPSNPQESCAITPCLDMTNLHFYRLTVSRDAPQDVVSSVHTFGAQLRIDFANPTKYLRFECCLASVVSNSSTPCLGLGTSLPIKLSDVR